MKNERPRLGGCVFVCRSSSVVVTDFFRVPCFKAGEPEKLIHFRGKELSPQNFVKKCLRILEKYKGTPLDFQILSLNLEKI